MYDSFQNHSGTTLGKSLSCKSKQEIRADAKFNNKQWLNRTKSSPDRQFNDISARRNKAKDQNHQSSIPLSTRRDPTTSSTSSIENDVPKGHRYASLSGIEDLVPNAPGNRPARPRISKISAITGEPPDGDLDLHSLSRNEIDRRIFQFQKKWGTPYARELIHNLYKNSTNGEDGETILDQLHDKTRQTENKLGNHPSPNSFRPRRTTIDHISTTKRSDFFSESPTSRFHRKLPPPPASSLTQTNDGGLYYKRIRLSPDTQGKARASSRLQDQENRDPVTTGTHDLKKAQAGPPTVSDSTSYSGTLSSEASNGLADVRHINTRYSTMAGTGNRALRVRRETYSPNKIQRVNSLKTNNEGPMQRPRIVDVKRQRHSISLGTLPESPNKEIQMNTSSPVKPRERSDLRRQKDDENEKLARPHE